MESEIAIDEPALVFLRELWSLNHALEQASKRMQTKLGVTAQQRMVLRFIGKHPGITARELAQILHLDGGTLSIALKRLETRDLITRKADSGDKRRARISLTPRGRRLDTPTSGLVEIAVARTLQKTKPAEVHATRAFLRRLVGLLSEVQ